MVWETTSFDLIFTIESSCFTKSVVFSPSGRLIAVPKSEEGLILLGTATGEILHTLTDCLDSLRFAEHGSLRFTEDDHLLIVKRNSDHLKIYHTGTGALVKEILYTGRILGTSLHGKLVAVLVSSGEIQMWKLMDNSLLSTLLDSQHHTDSWRYAFSPDEKQFISCRNDETINIWDAITGNLLWNSGQIVLLRCGWFCWLPESDLIAIMHEKRKSVSFWSTNDADVGRTYNLVAPVQSVYILTLSPDGRFVASRSGNESMFKLWNLGDGSLFHTLPDSSRYGQCKFTPNSKYLVTASWDEMYDPTPLKLWRISTGESLWTSPAYTVRIWGFKFSPNSQYLAFRALTGRTMVLSTLTGKPLFDIGPDQNPESDTAFIVDSSQLAYFSSGLVQIWSLAWKDLQTTVKISSTIVGCIASPMNGKHLILSSKVAIRSINLQTQTVQLIHDGETEIYNACLSEDDEAAAFTTVHDQIKIYSFKHRKIQRTIDSGAICRLTFVPGQQSIETERGIISLTAGHSGKGSQYIYITDDWITIDQKKWLWIPPLYRPPAIDYHDGKLILGFLSGRILFFDCMTGISKFLI